MQVKRNATALSVVAILLIAGFARAASLDPVAPTPPAQSAPAATATSPVPTATNIPPQPGITVPVMPGTEASGTGSAPQNASGKMIPEDYRIGPQDLLEIQIFGIEGLKRDVRVNWRGAISLP